jgi:hypothetical protein
VHKRHIVRGFQLVATKGVDNELVVE